MEGCGVEPDNAPQLLDVLLYRISLHVLVDCWMPTCCSIAAVDRWQCFPGLRHGRHW